MKCGTRGKFVLAVILAFGLVANSLFSNYVFADETLLDRVSQDEYRLDLSPASKRMTIKPGEQKKGDLQVKNTGTKAVIVDIYATPYTSENGIGEQKISMGEDYTKITEWITFKDSNGSYQKKISFNLEPNQIRDIRYAVNVPKEAVGGGQYAILFAEFNPIKTSESETAGIQSRSRVGMALFTTIDDEGIIRDSQIKDIQTAKIAIDSNVFVGYTAINTGNVDFQTSTEMTVKSITGDELYHNIAVDTVLPDVYKVIREEWEDTPSLGLFHLSYTLKALDEIIEEEHLILVMPTGALIALVPIIVLIIVGLRYLKMKRARDNRAIILGEKSY